MIRWLQSHLKGPIWQDRRRVYAIVVNVMAQVTGFIAGLMTPSSQGAWLVWSFCIPYTYLLYCRFQKMRGGFTEAEYAQEIDFVRQNLQALAPDESHWQQYLQAWV